jgi:hypothetical protein
MFEETQLHTHLLMQMWLSIQESVKENVPLVSTNLKRDKDLK